MIMRIQIFANEEEMSENEIFMSWATHVESMSEIPKELRMAADQLDESGGKPAFVNTALGAMPYDVYAAFLENGIFEE